MAFYVSVQDNGRSGFLAGPFRTHGEALAVLPHAKTEAKQADRDAHWYAFGTAHHKTSHAKRGVLNTRLGLTLDSSGYVQ